MKSLALILVLIATISCVEFVEEDDVIVLTKDNFEQVLETYEYVLVEFYAPWCGHCKKLAPEYTQAAQELKKKGEGYIPLAKLDATVEADIANRYDIKGFPTLKFFTRSLGPDAPLTYEGAREAGPIVAYINKKTGPSSTLLNTLDEITAVTSTVGEVPVCIYFGERADEAEFLVFERTAAGVDRVQFYHTTAPEAREHYALQAGVRVALFKNFDEKRNDFTKELTEAELSSFINANALPTVLPFNDKAIQSIFQQGNSAVFLFANENEESVKAFEVFSSIAGQYKDKVKFSFSKPNDGFGLFGRLAEYVGADQNALPNIMLVAPQQGNAKYRFTQEINVENLQNFVDAFVAGTLQRFLKSEEVPATNDEPVKVVVGKNFDDLVINNTQDVLVEFYAPWCGHCKTLAPIYEDLALKLSAVNKNIVLAKCDATANEVPSVDVQSFPTLKFWKNGDKANAIAFSGDRDFDGIVKFLQENTSHTWVDIEGQKKEDL